MSHPQPTNAASSDVSLPKKQLKELMRRSNRHAFFFLAGNGALLLATGFLLHLSLWSWWTIPALLLYGGILATASYALSHECAHGTAFRSRAINEACFWLTSLIYMESPTHRRFAHAKHHTYTWIKGEDAQMPFATPLTFWGYLLEVSGLGMIWYEGKLHLQLAAGHISEEVAAYLPESERGKAIREARIFLSVYALTAVAILATGAIWPITYIILPRLAGGVVMQLFTIIQHAEMAENVTDLRLSTRSFSTSWLGKLIYWNMNNHVEHHMYPTVPFHALPQLAAAVVEQVSAPSRGLMATNWQVFAAAFQRSFGRRDQFSADLG